MLSIQIFDDDNIFEEMPGPSGKHKTHFHWEYVNILCAVYQKDNFESHKGKFHPSNPSIHCDWWQQVAKIELHQEDLCLCL